MKLTTVNSLKELQSSIEDLKRKEEEYMQLKRKYQADENKRVREMQNGISEVLISLEVIFLWI